MIPRLITIDWPLSERTIYLDEPVVSIGRDALNDICLEDQFISRHHCLIRSVGDKFLIEDLNSANGTYVNNERVKESSLEEGAQIRIGMSLFSFRLQNPDESEALSQNLVGFEYSRSPLEEVRAG